jgi:hypothetical protein
MSRTSAERGSSGDCGRATLPCLSLGPDRLQHYVAIVLSGPGPSWDDSRGNRQETSDYHKSLGLLSKRRPST